MISPCAFLQAESTSSDCAVSRKEYYGILWPHAADQRVNVTPFLDEAGLLVCGVYNCSFSQSKWCSDRSDGQFLVDKQTQSL